MPNFDLPDSPKTFPDHGRPPANWLHNPTHSEMRQYVQVMNRRHQVTYEMYLDLLQAVSLKDGPRVAVHSEFAQNRLAQYAPDKLDSEKTKVVEEESDL